MKIFIVGYEHPYIDKRTFKSAANLSKTGEVYYQYYGKFNGEKLPNIKTIEFEKLERSSNFIHWIKKWKKFDEILLSEILKVDPDIVYFHYLPFTGAKMFKKLKDLNKKIIFEIHEIIPEQFMMRYLSKYSFFKKIIKKKLWKEFLDAIIISDGIIAISEDILNYIFDLENINKKYLILPNLALKSINSTKKNKEIILVGKDDRKLYNEKKIILKLIENGFHFKVIGINPSNFTDIPHTYIKPLPYFEMLQEVSKSLFSLISYANTKEGGFLNYKYSLPNKFFDSLAADTPVIVKEDFVSMARIVKELNIGVIINPKNTEESVKKIIEAHENYEELINNIRKHKNKFIWNEKIDMKFVEFIKEISEVNK